MVRPPMCTVCKHYRPQWDGFSCEAFPEGIPQEIVVSLWDHRVPHFGDNGYRFSPVDRDAAAYADSLFPDGPKTDLVPEGILF